MKPVIQGGNRIKAFGVAEGGGVLVYPSKESAKLQIETLADPAEIRALSWITKEVLNNNPVMATMLEDTKPDDQGDPMKTDYITNTVITLPTNFGILLERFKIKRVDLERAIQGINPQNYVKMVLRYAAFRFDKARTKLGLEEYINLSLIKEPNRRVYVTPKHLRGKEEELSKAGGVRFGSKLLRSMPGYEGFREYRIEDSVYVADMAVVTTSEGQKAIGPAERNMIIGLTRFHKNRIPSEVNILRQERLGEINDPTGYTAAEVAPRLVINVTMDRSPMTLTTTEKVLVLNAGSGNKAMDAYRFIYDRLEPDLAA